MNTSKMIITSDQIKEMVSEILVDMADDDFQPNYVVGITRGGLVPALMISHRLDIPMETLRICLRDHVGERTETNCWMAEDAIGYPKGHNLKKILIVDDITDSGATIKWLKNDWEKCVPAPWANVWHQNVRFASLITNATSEIDPDYFSLCINKELNPTWVEFPWEKWW